MVDAAPLQSAGRSGPEWKSANRRDSYWKDRSGRASQGIWNDQEYSRWRPQTAALTTGQPMTLRWTCGALPRSRVNIGRSRIITERSSSTVALSAVSTAKPPLRETISASRLRAYLRLECHRFNTGVSWFEAKQSIVRNAIAQYRASPLYSRTSLESA